MKKFIKKNWLLIVALLAVGTFVEQKAVSAYQTSWLTTYTYQQYSGSKLISSDSQGAYFGWNGALQRSSMAIQMLGVFREERLAIIASFL